jgi:nucleotide-binding universal stress UspA family protein
MFRTAMIALDHSAAQGPLLDCLTDLRDMSVARVVLIHVVRLGYGQGAEFGNKGAFEDWLQDCATPMREAGLEVEIDVRAAGEVAPEILQAAAEHGADLIVIGSRGQNMLRGLFLGSVAREVVRLSLLPVRLEWIEVNGEDGLETCERACHAGLQRVLLATDLSPHARAAEAAAAELAGLAGFVEILHVLSPDEMARYTRWKVMVRAALDDIAHEIAAAGGTAEVQLAEGKPSESIARLAGEREADLIVLGKHGQNWVESMAIGSTAAALCEIARRSVLMVPLRRTES